MTRKDKMFGTVVGMTNNVRMYGSPGYSQLAAQKHLQRNFVFKYRKILSPSGHSGMVLVKHFSMVVVEEEVMCSIQRKNVKWHAIDQLKYIPVT